MAWDYVSWPGNDFYGDLRNTDDGVKAAATNSMEVMGYPFANQYRLRYFYADFAQAAWLAKVI